MEQPHKRILVVSQHYWPENFRITDICRGFAESGVEVDVLCGLPNYPKGEWFEGYCYAGPRRQQHEGAQLFRAGEVPRRRQHGRAHFSELCVVACVCAVQPAQAARAAL